MTVKELKEVLNCISTPIYIQQWNSDRRTFDSARFDDLDELADNTDFDDFEVDCVDVFDRYINITIERM